MADRPKQIAVFKQIVGTCVYNMFDVAGVFDGCLCRY
jgi:hypothetical protein